MKAALNGHIEQQRHVMFQRSADEVRHLLQGMVKDVQKTMDEKTDEIFLAVRRDYRSVLGGNDLPQGELLPKAQRLMRKKVMSKIDRADKLFKKVAGLEVEDDEEEDEDEAEQTGEEEDIDQSGSVAKDLDESVPPYSPSRQGSASNTTIKREPVSERQADEDAPTADAPVATKKFKAEVDESDTIDHTNTTTPSPATAVIADPVSAKDSKTSELFNPPGTSRSYPSLSPVK